MLGMSDVGRTALGLVTASLNDDFDMFSELIETLSAEELIEITMVCVGFLTHHIRTVADREQVDPIAMWQKIAVNVVAHHVD